ncbi:MAG: LLM class flavin-dependent oxidoreductase [Ilumatobacteraceae bacterium]
MTIGRRDSPFGKGAISLGLYTHPELGPRQQLESVIGLARVADAVGFDGVTFSEHHAGFPGYLPDPALVSGWVLEVTDSIWAGACPTVLTLRNPRLVAEQLVWTASALSGTVRNDVRRWVPRR